MVLSSTTSDLDMKEFVSTEIGSRPVSGPASLLASSYLSRRNRWLSSSLWSRLVSSFRSACRKCQMLNWSAISLLVIWLVIWIQSILVISLVVDWIILWLGWLLIVIRSSNWMSIQSFGQLLVYLFVIWSFDWTSVWSFKLVVYSAIQWFGWLWVRSFDDDDILTHLKLCIFCCKSFFGVR